MWSISNFPQYEITVWLKTSPSVSRIERLLYDAAGDNPYMSAESDDAKDYHWGFASADNALEALERMKIVSEDSAVLVLRFKSRDPSVESFTIKDTRRVLH